MMATTVAPMIPVDDPGIWTLRDSRQWQTQLTDNLWVRLVDVPAALRARTYARDLDIVLDVRDDLLPDNAGRYRLSSGAHRGVVRPNHGTGRPAGDGRPARGQLS